MSLDLALSYTPPGSDLSLTLALVRDSALLVAALRNAIAEADHKAKREVNPVAAAGYRKQRDFLTECLRDATVQWPANVM